MQLIVDAVDTLIRSILDTTSYTLRNVKELCGLQAYQVDSPQSRFSYATLLVTVADSNVHRPEMLQSRYNVTIPENSPAGYYVRQVQARDLDQVRGISLGL